MKLPPEAFIRLVEKKVKHLQRGLDRHNLTSKKTIPLIWRNGGASENSKMRFLLLDKTGWDTGWAVMEWHRLPDRLRTDLEGLPALTIETLIEKDTDNLRETGTA